MKAGVSITPWAVVRRPRLAFDERLSGVTRTRRHLAAVVFSGKRNLTDAQSVRWGRPIQTLTPGE